MGDSEEWRERGDNWASVLFPYLEGGDAIVTSTQRTSLNNNKDRALLQWPSMANSQDTLKSCIVQFSLTFISRPVKPLVESLRTTRLQHHVLSYVPCHFPVSVKPCSPTSRIVLANYTFLSP